MRAHLASSEELRRDRNARLRSLLVQAYERVSSDQRLSMRPRQIRRVLPLDPIPTASASAAPGESQLQASSLAPAALAPEG
jgi:hypothetical protein